MWISINGDACDFDGDNDGVFDEDDDCPQGTINWTANPFTDYDSDGCLDSNAEDPDDDNDGVSISMTFVQKGSWVGYRSLRMTTTGTAARTMKKTTILITIIS